MSSLLQLAVAFIIVLVVPGFAASLALFPRLNQIDVTERLAISIGLSITIVIAVGILLSYGTIITGVTGGITVFSLSAALAVVTFLSLFVWALRATSLAITARRQASKQRQAVSGLRIRSQQATTKLQRQANRKYNANKSRETTAPDRENSRSKRKDTRPKRGA